MDDKPQTLYSRVLGTLISWRLVLLAVAVGLTIISWPIARSLKFDQSIESLYSPDDPYLQNYLQSKRWFGGDEFLLVGYVVDNLFEKDGATVRDEPAREILAFAEKLNEVPGIQEKSTQNYVDSSQYPLIWQRERARKLLENLMVNSEGDVTAILLRLEPRETAEVPRTETFERVRQLAENHQPKAYVVGEPLQIYDMFRYVEEDGELLFYVSLGLLAAVLMVLFLNPHWVLLPLLVVISTILWTRAGLVLSGMRLSMVSSMLNSLVTIIGIATVMHMTVHYRDLRKYHPPLDSLRKAMRDLVPPIFWTCATTAAGFGALLVSDITPVRSFGIMMLLGSMIVFLASVMILPGGILLGHLTSDPRATLGERKLARGLQSISQGGIRHPGIVLIIGLTLTASAAWGLTRLSVETDFSKNFRESSLIVQSLGFVETRLGGAGNWEVNFPAPSSRDELTPEYLDKIARLTRRLKELKLSGTEEPGLTSVISLTEGLELTPEKFLFKEFTIQDRMSQIDGLQPEFIPTLYSPEDNRMRIALRSRERQSAEQKLRLIDEVEKLAREEFPEAEGEKTPKATGIFVLLAYLIQNLLRDQLSSFLLAAAGVVTMMVIAFRSFSVGLITLIPNLFPIVLVIGAMGWLDLPVNIGTAMIASVSMGLTVDSSIHYISSFQRLRSEGASVQEALNQTQDQVGRALLFGTVAQILGFTVLTLSHFIPLIYFGVLVSIAMFGGLVGNLILLPLMLSRLVKEEVHSPQEPATVSAN